jgi:hypothetical protein
MEGRVETDLGARMEADTSSRMEESLETSLGKCVGTD